MGTITAQAIIDKAQTILQDTTEVRWTETELLGWLNDGQREIAIMRPDLFSVLANVTCVAGTKQSIPANGTALLRVIRNMGVGGATPGRAIRQVPMDLLDANVPDWHTKASATEILHVATDPKMPKVFYTYPPATVSTQLEVLYGASPTDVAAKGNAIGVDDVFATPLIDYLCFRAYSKDQDLTGNTERATSHLQKFTSTVNAKTAADSAVVANNLNVKG